MPASTQPARGMRDFLPEDVRRREYVIGIVADVYRCYGFEPLETPAVENIETLMGKYGEEGDRLIFRILKRGAEGQSGQADLALRYDLTVPLARVVAEYRARLPKVFKRYQVQPVWRADRPQKGRFREFYQCDVDVVGSRSPLVEAELCAAAGDVLERLGFRDFVIRLNDRRVLAGLLDAAGLPREEHATALVAIDKLDKIGMAGVHQELLSRGIASEVAGRLVAVFGERAADDESPHDGAARWARFLSAWTAGQSGAAAVNPAPLGPASDEARAAIRSLETILELARGTSAGSHVRLDLSLARGLSYYTGAIMEIAVPDLAGSLGGGGRYDQLIGMFLGEDVPACGFSLGLERILVVMAERGMFPDEVTAVPAEVLVTLWSADRAAAALALASDLRRSGLRVDLYPDPDKIRRQLKYASARGIPTVILMGEDETARGEVTIKDMTTGAQRAVARDRVVDALRHDAP